jgi:hypothetical protein
MYICIVINKVNFHKSIFNSKKLNNFNINNLKKLIMEELQLKTCIYGSFLNFIDRYNLIFSQYYPAHDSTGFTERNLTCNFAESLKTLIDKDSFIWYETPIGDNKHIDATVFSQKQKAIFFIEAKRLGQQIKRQIDSLKDDIKRIDTEINENNQENATINYILEELSWKNNSQTRYIVFICDYWDESDNGFQNIENKLKENFENFEIISQKGFNTENTQYPCLRKYSIFLGWKKL